MVAALSPGVTPQLQLQGSRRSSVTWGGSAAPPALGLAKGAKATGLFPVLLAAGKSAPPLGTCQGSAKSKEDGKLTDSTHP